MEVPPAGFPAAAEHWLAMLPDVRQWIVELILRCSAQLRAELNSTNSSKPPSTDPPGLARRRRPPSGRKPGGQPGHEGTTRPLVPRDKVDEVFKIHPSRCKGCRRSLSGEQALPNPRRHQVAEIPEIRPRVTEFVCFSAECPDCKEVTTAELPEGAPSTCFGPNLRAFIVTMCGRFRMSRREVKEFCAEALGLDISVGTIDNICRGVAELLEEPAEEIRESTQQEPVVHCDESGWRQRGKKHWIWVVASSLSVYFLIAGHRGSEVARRMLGGFDGYVVTDRWSGYSFLNADRRQVCWAHLKRDFQRIVDRGGIGRPFGEAGLELTKELFGIWHRHKTGEVGRQAMQAAMEDVERRLGVLLAEGLESGDKKVMGFAKKLMAIEPALFNFARHCGVEPTNNHAERVLRPVVLWRKGSFGTSSDAGSRFVARMMTVVMTARLRGLPVLRYLRAVFEAADHGRPTPSLLGMCGSPRDRPRRAAEGSLSRAG